MLIVTKPQAVIAVATMQTALIFLKMKMVKVTKPQAVIAVATCIILQLRFKINEVTKPQAVIAVATYKDNYDLVVFSALQNRKR